MGVQVPTREEAILRVIYSNWLNRGQHWYSADADWGVLHGVHTGATWQIRLNRPCVAARRPDVKLLWPVVLYNWPPYQQLLHILSTAWIHLQHLRTHHAVRSRQLAPMCLTGWVNGLFQRHPGQLLSMTLKKLKLTQPNQTCNSKPIQCMTQNKHNKKTKPIFGRLLRRLAWKWNGHCFYNCGPIRSHPCYTVTVSSTASRKTKHVASNNFSVKTSTGND